MPTGHAQGAVGHRSPAAGQSRQGISPSCSAHGCAGPGTSDDGARSSSDSKRRLNRIDLLDLSPLRPFTRQGLTNALAWIGLLSIYSLMLLETGFGRLMAVNGGVTVVVATLALLAPVQGVHQRIRHSKEVT